MASCIVYVETNLLVAVATGRQTRGDDLLAAASAAVRLAVPAACFMEAFSTLEDERFRSKHFHEAVQQRLGQLRRDQTSAHTQPLVARLEEALLLESRRLNDIQDRLFTFVDRLSRQADIIDVTPALIQQSTRTI